MTHLITALDKIAMQQPLVAKVKARSITMRQRPTYQVGKKLYRTLRAAARAEAWAMIAAKYCDGFKRRTLSDVSCVHGMTCECNSDERDYSCCQIHDRHYGYFARVHKRLSALVEQSFKEEVKP